MQWEEFRKDRREALLSLDEQKIRAYCQKWGAEMPRQPEVFWAGIHKARLACLDVPEAEKQKSRQWLRQRGFSLKPF